MLQRPHLCTLRLRTCRQQSAVLVCKRLYQACHSPTLLQSLEVRLPWRQELFEYFGDVYEDCEEHQLLQLVRSFQTWMQPQARLLRSLDLNILLMSGRASPRTSALGLECTWPQHLLLRATSSSSAYIGRCTFNRALARTASMASRLRRSGILSGSCMG